MALNNATILFQITFCVLTLVLSLCVFLPLGFHIFQFKGHCLLFTNGTWNENDGKFLADWGSQGYCDFSLVWALVNFFLALKQLHKFLCFLYNESDSNFLGAFVDVLLSVCMTAFSLFGAVMITMGYQVWCDAIMLRFERCEDASSNSIFKDDSIDTSMFDIQFGITQFGIWCLWVCWVGMSVTSMLKLYKLHQIENIRSSMWRERTRLVRNQDASPQI